MKKDNVILDKTINFSLNSIEGYKKLVAQNEFVISKQFLRSATSIGANVNEAIAAQSKKDFINKMAIASKEARETRYWLILIEKSKIAVLDCSALLKEIDEIIRIITAIVKTTQEHLKEYSTI
jgi:four helix bundle protein